jgi:hypothetical protein
MALLIFFVGLAIWLFLERQSLRHKREMEIEFARLKFPPPPAEPGLPVLEAWLNIALGAILSGYSLLALVTMFLDPVRGSPGEMGRFAVVILAAGVVMVVVGVKRIAQNRLLRKELAGGDRVRSNENSRERRE